MAERYKRYVTNVTAGVATEVYEAPNDGASGSAQSVIIGFLIASTSDDAGTVTIELFDFATNGTGLTQKTFKLADTIPLPADTSVDIIPGKFVVEHAGNNEGTPVLTGDILKITSTKTCDVIISVVERV